MAEGKGNPITNLEVEKVEEATKALERLIDALAKLKENGMLDMIIALADMSEELMELGLNDRRLHHAMAAADGALNALEYVDPIVFKENVEYINECAVKALDNPKLLKELKPVGLGGLLKVMKDPDIGIGLALMLAIAKSLGRCLREKASLK
ncbi:hypothetical protein EYM_05405 [Ignicoccus islandicus DSM 13165]|uniref:DUF1641 domain-containing protein n=1 Tax=Ignicoccus islandicus DSM 13165 TaxID=940295 RepID=A0A0U3E1Q3_9CREN|nr:DUF1641 domain-containing protein [Ignicoccus islandicus]ALU11851.1 hypothetical protein EYM_05405 [Ignicoccus islandicus DSM 13165]